MGWEWGWWRGVGVGAGGGGIGGDLGGSVTGLSQSHVALEIELVEVSLGEMNCWSFFVHLFFTFFLLFSPPSLSLFGGWGLGLG